MQDRLIVDSRMRDQTSVFSSPDPKVSKVLESPSIEELIQKGQEEKLHQQQIWLIDERGWDAKDNGFVFYAWLKKYYPEINAYYVITQNSADYQKIAEIDSKTIIEYNSEQHKCYYLFSKFVISSQGGNHCHPLNYERLKTHYPSIFKSQFIFLQHGVLKDYISYFHKGHFNSALFIISGEMERRLFEIVYQYTPDDLALTGLCRFDLLSNHHNKQPYIFFMPTWRAWIKNEKDFLASKYYRELKELLNHPELNQLLNKHRFQLKFFIHPNFSSYSKFFKSASSSIEILTGDEDIGTLIRECSLMMSDYSSAIIDAAYMDKPIVYYQPDYDKFRASHYSETCFYSYVEHGLGAVVTSLSPLLDEISTILDSGCANSEKYRERANYIFAHRDKEACQRTFDAILKHENLPERLSQLYTSSALIKMGYFQVLVKDNILYVFLTTDEKTGIMVQKFSIGFSLMTGEKKSQEINLPNASMTLFIEEKLVYAFATSLPDLTSSIDIQGHSHKLLSPMPVNSEHKNVAQLGFTVDGGAGIATLRLHKGLLDSGVNSFLFQKKKTKTSAPYRVYTFENDSNNAITDWNNRQNTYEGNTIFTLSSPSEHKKYDFLDNFDILNFHWIAKYLSIETIAYLSHQNKPIVWTFHDINPLAGGCHAFHGCKSWQTDCMNCPQLIGNYDNYPAKILAAKKKYFNFKNITVVVLNQHFKKLVEQSPLFNQSRVEVIPNSIDIDIFKPLDKQQTRQKLGLEENKKYLLYVSAYASIIKGYKEFEQTISEYEKQYGSNDIEILLVGNLPKHRNIKLPFKEFGHVGEDKIIELYSASEVTVLSSIEDNLPNVILESFSCGTPIVGFKVGGLPDMVKDDYNGYTVELGDIKGLADSINKVLDGKDLSGNCREYAEENLGLEVQAKRYKALYEDLLSRPAKATEERDSIPEVFSETAPIVIKLLNEAVSLKEKEKNELAKKQKILDAENQKKQQQIEQMSAENQKKQQQLNKYSAECQEKQLIIDDIYSSKKYKLASALAAPYIKAKQIMKNER